MKKICWALFFLCGNALAGEFQIGPTYKIDEENPATWLVEKQLPKLEANGEMERLEKMMQQKAKHSIENPKGVNLPHTISHKVQSRSLLKRLGKDIKDADGQVIITKGTINNPYQYLPESPKTMLFIDGSSEPQVRYAIKERKKNRLLKVVFTQGKPLEKMRTHHVPFYFDQHQRLVGELNITHVPAKVYRQSTQLIIEEFVLPEDV
jgi:conjugal transfer pilus assembly protein TraW